MLVAICLSVGLNISLHFLYGPLSHSYFYLLFGVYISSFYLPPQFRPSLVLPYLNFLAVCIPLLFSNACPRFHEVEAL